MAVVQIRRKPARLEGVQFTGTAENLAEAGAFLSSLVGKAIVYTNTQIHIGAAICDWGDWLLKNSLGEIFTCRGDLFDESYEVVPEEDGEDVRDAAH